MWIVRALLTVCSAAVLAQGPAPRGFEFDAVSVKRSPSGPLLGSISYPPGAIRITNMPLRSIIAEAVEVGPSLNRPDLTDHRLEGGSVNALSARFDITATTRGVVSPPDRPAAIRALLADRFKLRIHVEARQRPVYALTVLPRGTGPRLRRSTVDCLGFIRSGGSWPSAPPELLSKCGGATDTRGPARLAGAARQVVSAGPISSLIRTAQAYLDRVLVDATGLVGNFEWNTSFATAADAGVPTIFDAFEDDLGLRIESRTGLVGVFVIDGVDLPLPD